MDGFVQSIKQYPGQQQVDRSVKVKVPGKHFPQLQASEQAAMYWGTAVEFRERQKFPRHAKAWGGSTPGPESDSSAIPTPSTTRTTKASAWTTLALFRRLRRSLVWRGKLVCRRARRPDRDPNRRGSLNSNSSSLPHMTRTRLRVSGRPPQRFTRRYLYSQFSARPALSFTFTFSKLSHTPHPNCQ